MIYGFLYFVYVVFIKLEKGIVIVEILLFYLNIYNKILNYKINIENFIYVF